MPLPFTYLMMKLFAFRDRKEDRDKKLFRHHALDLYAIAAMQVESEYQESRRLGTLYGTDGHVQAARRRMAGDRFCRAAGASGVIRLREHPLFRPEFPFPTSSLSSVRSFTRNTSLDEKTFSEVRRDYGTTKVVVFNEPPAIDEILPALARLEFENQQSQNSVEPCRLHGLERRETRWTRVMILSIITPRPKPRSPCFARSFVDATMFILVASRAARPANPAISLPVPTSGLQACARNPRSSAPTARNRRFLPVTDDVIRWHLSGRDDNGRDFVMGVYPMLQDETCFFLAADFDKTHWQEDAGPSWKHAAA